MNIDLNADDEGSVAQSLIVIGVAILVGVVTYLVLNRRKRGGGERLGSGNSSRHPTVQTYGGSEEQSVSKRNLSGVSTVMPKRNLSTKQSIPLPKTLKVESNQLDQEKDSAVQQQNCEPATETKQEDKQTPVSVESSEKCVVKTDIEKEESSSSSSSSASTNSTAGVGSDKKNMPDKQIQSRQATKTSEPGTLVDLLAYILEAKIIVLQPDEKRPKWEARTLVLKASDVNISLENIDIKCLPLFDRRSSQVFASQVQWCTQCYNRCSERITRLSSQPLHTKVIQYMQNRAVDAIIECLTKDSQLDADVDDLWSSIAHNNADASQSEHSHFVQSLSRWSSEGTCISDPLLARILQRTQELGKGTQLIQLTLGQCSSTIARIKRCDDINYNHGTLLNSLERLVSHAQIAPIISEIMKKEILLAKNSLGSYFEKRSVIGGLLAVTTVPDCVMTGNKLTSEASKPYVSLPSFPNSRVDDIRLLSDRIQKGISLARSVVFQLLKRMVKADRDTALGWLGGLLNNNELRTNVSVRVHPSSQEATACSDGYMLNLCNVLLDLCMPFCTGDLTKVAKISHTYAASRSCPINYNFEACLAGGQIVNSEVEKSTKEENFNFITQIYHITVRALSIGYMTAMGQHKQQMRVMQQGRPGNISDADWLKMQVLLSLKWDTCFIEHDLCKKVTQFYLTTAQWIQYLTSEELCKGDNAKQMQRDALSVVPEYIIKDMAQWFTFLLMHPIRIHRNLLTGLQVSPFVDCCVLLLSRPDLMPGPLPAYRIAQALLAFLQTGNQRQNKSRQGASVNLGQSGISDLSALVHTCSSVQNHLCPALVHTYVSVDVVEGLDVDKEDFDKYGARAEISRLLTNLWDRADCRRSVIKLCGTSKFQDFLGCILGTLLYQIHDSLYRLTNIKRLQTAKEDKESWNKLSPKEQGDKEKWLKGEERVAKGFLSMANLTLNLVSMITMSDEITQCFTVMPLAQRAASAFLGFLDALCGPKSLDLKVKDMDKYSFNPSELLQKIVSILVRIVQQETSRQSGFVHSLSVDADYNPAVMQKAASVLAHKAVSSDLVMVEQFEALIKQLEEMISTAEASTSDAATANVSATDDIGISDDTNEKDIADITEEYIEKMSEFRYDTVEFEENHTYYENAEQSCEVSTSRTKALAKEMKQWGEVLPIHPNASIFVRQDEDHMDLVRACVTGPPDTPYAAGCFIFDIYFPATYPNIPPIVKLITTGNGLVRFNPNLYADGKVCLSLLGTWHGGDSSQKWQPDTSTLYQVLLSIQSMILISEPMFNEPGYESVRDTTEGRQQCAEYNAKIRLYTARHSILEYLERPPLGFEDVMEEHFRMQRHVIRHQLQKWLTMCTTDDGKQKLQKTVAAINKLLAKFDETETTGDSMENKDSAE